VWDKRYRPLRYADVLGQEGSVELLKARIRNKTAFDTSYVFSGRHGRGKTTLGRIHARAMLCQQMNYKDPEPCNECDNCKAILEDQPSAYSERDSANQASAEEVRAIIEGLSFVLENAPMRIYLFDEAHSMSKTAQDALLKPTEEKRVVCMFCTTEVEKLRGAIRSRCEEYTIRKVTREKLLERMRLVLDTEAVKYEDDAVLVVIDNQGGHVRDVLNTLEAISQVGPITTDNVREYLRLSSVTLHYQILLHLDDPNLAIKLLDQACEMETPEEVAGGLAEAAMNSYRTAHRMVHDFSQVDRSLAEQIYAKYKDNVRRFARWFLSVRAKSPTKLSLTLDLVDFYQSPGNLPQEGPQPPVIFSIGHSLPTAVALPLDVPAPSLPPPTTEGEASPAPVEPPAAAQSVVVAEEPVVVEATAAASQKLDPRSIPEAAPSTEIEAVAMSKPLQRQRSSVGFDTGMPPRQKKAVSMSPGEWRDNFERLYRKRRTS
jgi:DNA polymerase III subunit gamma/tau